MQEEHAESLASIREQARRLLVDQATPEHLKSLLDEPASFDQPLWDHAVDQGWPSIAIAEDMGGLGLGWSGLGVLCEETGRLTASLPLIANSVAAHALQSDKGTWNTLIEALASGSKIACLALSDPQDSGLASSPSLLASNSGLRGEKALAAFANVADIALVQAQGEQGNGLYLVDLAHPGVTRRTFNTVDNARAAAVLQFNGVPATLLGGVDLLLNVSSLAALACACEQIGGAQASLDLACDYARERRAFGQQIGSFQGIKHKLAEAYCLLEIAKGCTNDALNAWEQGLAHSRQLGAAARIAATKAYDYIAQEGLHVHGGMGMTWEAMPHHHYRRSRSLALELGSIHYWRERLLSEIGLETANHG
jgi:alkylation response protein AidB-like acyl-CoA dehydrogenase